MAPGKKKELPSLKTEKGEEESPLSRLPKPDPLHPLIGQEECLNHVRHAVEKGRVSHAYILEGSAGSGKKTLADYFAMSLLCQEPRLGKPCGRCESCRLLLSGNHPDYRKVGLDEKGNVSVSLVREKLVSDIEILPYRSGRKVYVIDQAHTMNNQSQNVLLKTIEEPPEYGVILLLSENADAFLPTVRSRCIEVKLHPLTMDTVQSILVEQYQIDPVKAASAAAFADGSVGQAIRMALSEEFGERRDRWLGHGKALVTESPVRVLSWASELEQDREHLDEVIRILLLWFRDLLVFQETRDPSRCFCRDESESISQSAGQYTFEDLVRKIRHLEEAQIKLRHNVNFSLWCDYLLMGLVSNTEK